MKRFAQGRATLEMRLAEPVELLRELEQRSPFEFRVRDRRFDRLVLDVDASRRRRRRPAGGGGLAGRRAGRWQIPRCASRQPGTTNGLV